MSQGESKQMFKVAADEAGLRLDSFLVKSLPHLGRRRAKELCEVGQVTVNGQILRAGISVKSGDQVVIFGGEEVLPRPEKVATEGLKLEVLYEDEGLIVVNKARAMPSIIHRPDDPLTVADWLAFYSPACRQASPDKRECGLVQRLDYFTSGLIMAAKTRETWQFAKQAMKTGAIKKEYLALVQGKLAVKKLLIDKPLKQTPDGKKMQLADSGDTNEDTNIFTAKSEVEELKQFQLKGVSCAIVRVSAASVRRHQVRLHLASIGNPLIGDSDYGARYSLSEVGEAAEGFYLLASKISFELPVKKEISLSASYMEKFL